MNAMKLLVMSTLAAVENRLPKYESTTLNSALWIGLLFMWVVVVGAVVYVCVTTPAAMACD